MDNHNPPSTRPDIHMDSTVSDTIPHIESVSNNSVAIEVEMQALDNPDDNSAGSQYFGSVDPPSSPPVDRPRSSLRRARIEEDEDDERDRRHPSQRVNQSSLSSPSNISNRRQTHSPSQGVPPIPIFPLPPNIQNFGTFEATNFMQQFFSGSIPPITTPREPANSQLQPRNSTSNTQPPNSGTSTAQPSPPAQGQPSMLGGFAITIDLSTGTPVVMPQPRRAPVPQQNSENLNSDAGDATRPTSPTNEPRVDVTSFAEILERLGLIGTVFGGRQEREQEDPDRAKKLVDGLEEVPIGLVRRLERVG